MATKQNNPINSICRSCKDCISLISKGTHFECKKKDNNRITEADLGCDLWEEIMPLSKSTNLNKVQEKFCQQFMIDNNGTQAAIRSGYSKNGASVQASRLLSNTNIQNYISHLRQIATQKLGTTHEQMLAELRNFAYSDITATMCMGLEQIKELPPEIRRMVVSYKSKTRLLQSKSDQHGNTVQMVEETFELKFVDKTKVIDMINRHIGFYELDNQQQNQTIIVIPPKR